MSAELCDCENTLLREIATKEINRKGVAMTYRLAMESDEADRIDWGKVNRAIMHRWSTSGLQWIKKMAHSGKCFQTTETFQEKGGVMEKMTKISPPLKWHGGKHYIASKIVAMMPPHLHYVEPYFGGGSVLLAKNPEGVSEVANDLDYGLTNFWAAIQNNESFKEFKRRVDAVPFSQVEWEGSKAEAADFFGGMTGKAVAFFIRCRQSLAGRMDTFAPLSRTRVRRGMNEQVSAWINAVDGLPVVHARLRRVVILNCDALELILKQDGPETLFYLDPPYLHETRATTGEYLHEMTRDQHENLLLILAGIKGKFLLSGYDSELYRQYEKLNGWNRTAFELPNNSAGGDEKRRMLEIVWTNFEVGGGA